MPDKMSKEKFIQLGTAIVAALALILAAFGLLSDGSNQPTARGTSNFDVVSAEDLIASDDVTVGDDLAVTGDTSIAGGTLTALTVNGNATVTGTSDLQGNVSDSGGDFTIADNAVVTGTADFQGDVSDSGGTLTMADNVAITGTSDLQGDISDSGGDLTIADNVDVTGTLQYGSGNLYPLGYATSGYEVYCSEATVTGTLVITSATHGITTPSTVLESMASAPGATAGDPFMPYSIWSGSTVTLTVAQDDGTNATSGATVDYCIIGQD